MNESNPQLSAAERHDLARLSEHVQANALPSESSGAQALADLLRQNLPDLDDVTIGRVTLTLGEYAGQVTHRVAPDDSGMLLLTNMMMMAGLDLTALEWRDAR